jgi:hypothetical protein
MKNIIHRILILGVLCFGFYSSFALQSKRDSIALTGKVFNDEEKVEHLVIKVYSNNELIKSQLIKSSNHFRVYLPKDQYLTIEIVAPNFHTKRFFFDSSVPKNLRKLPGYQFDMDIFSEKELEGVNTSFLDFPAGLVKYNLKKKVFLRDKAYTKRMKKSYFKLLEEAELSNRGILKDSK